MMEPQFPLLIRQPAQRLERSPRSARKKRDGQSRLPKRRGRPSDLCPATNGAAGFIKWFAEEARRLYGYPGITLTAFYAGSFAVIVSGTFRGLSVSSITRSAREVDFRW